MDDVEVRVDVELSATFYMPRKASKKAIIKEVFKTQGVKDIPSWMDIEVVRVIKYVDDIGNVL